MKLHLLTLAAAVLATFAFTSCGEKGPDYGDPNVKVSPGELSFESAGGAQTVQLTATVDWTVENQASWVVVAPTQGDPSKDVQTINITVAANNDLERTATVTFKQVDGTLSAKLTINQKANIPDIQDSNAKTVNDNTNAYKYQRFRLTGVVKNLKSDGSFNLVDETGSIAVAGLNASEQPYGTEGGALANVKERYTVTIVGYRVDVDGKAQIKYAFLEKVTEYSEPSPDTAATKSFPYTADYKAAENGAIVNNAVFPLAFDALWSWSASTGWRASGYKNADYTTEATLYTEKIDLKNAENPILVFDHVVRDFASIEAAKEQTSVLVRKDGGDWTPASVTFSYPETLGSEVMTSEEVKLDSYIGSVIQIAFKYVSDESRKAGTWQIVKVEVKKSEEPTQPDNSSGTEDYDKPGWDWNK